MGFIGMMGLPRYLSSPELIPYLCGLRLRVLFNSATPNIPKEVAVGRLFTHPIVIAIGTALPCYSLLSSRRK